MVNLDINVATLVIQLVATTVLFSVISIFFAKPMKKFMAKREAFVQASFDEAKQAQDNASKTRQALDNELAEFKSQSQQRLEAQILKARAKADEIIDAAKVDAVVEMEKAQAKIERERKAMLRDAKASIAKATTEATKQLIKREIDEQAHDDLFDEFVKLVGEADG